MVGPVRRIKSKSQCETEARLLGFKYSEWPHLFINGSKKDAKRYCPETMEELTVKEANTRYRRSPRGGTRDTIKP